jgi:phage protein D
VSEIAKAYNLNVSNVEATERVFDSIPQANRTDFEFCKYLASIEQNGSFRFFIKDGSLYFGKIDLGQETAFVYTYGINIISFKPTLKDSQTSTASSETEISTYDPVAKETITETADPLTVLEETLLGKKEVGTSSERKTESPTNVLTYDANGDEM